MSNCKSNLKKKKNPDHFFVSMVICVRRCLFHAPIAASSVLSFFTVANWWSYLEPRKKTNQPTVNTPKYIFSFTHARNPLFPPTPKALSVDIRWPAESEINTWPRFRRCSLRFRLILLAIAASLAAESLINLVTRRLVGFESKLLMTLCRRGKKSKKVFFSSLMALFSSQFPW